MDIPASLSPSSVSDTYPTGSVPGPGTFFCLDCGSQLALHEDERLPECPHCGASTFRLDSIFESRQKHPGTTVEIDAPAIEGPPRWLTEARALLPGSGRFLACRSSGEVRLFELAEGWTRIGRSSAADVRLDDPSVSRRHALVVSEPGHALRVLDDRSLNGVFLNGELVEWAKLGDGDELTVGRYRLLVLEA